MSLDVVNYSGVLFEAEELMTMLFPADEEAPKRAVAALGSALSRSASAIHPPGGEDATNLRAVCDKASLVAWFMGVLRTNLGDSTCYEDDKTLRLLWTVAVRAFGIRGLPSVTFEYFSSDREADDDVPHDVPCIAFADHDLFVRRMTSKGRRLARALGLHTIETTTWTDLYY